MSEVRMRALEGLPEIPPGDDLPARLAALVPPGPGILVVAQKIVSKAEGRLVRLTTSFPSARSSRARARQGAAPHEAVLRESGRVIRTAPAC
jgi:coenzyme F420-0:L-glutamate ligase/coenzyme F420-1:gamma-L-glutamate ligase